MGTPARGPTRQATEPEPRRPEGSVVRRDILEEYAAHLLSLVDLSGIRSLRIVVDAGNGMSGLTAPAVLGMAPVAIVPLSFELDGTFPHREANPLNRPTSSTRRTRYGRTQPSWGSPSTVTPTAVSSSTSAARR